MACSHFPQLHGYEHNEVSDSLDRLSELPDSIILLILSLLSSTRDAVRTTILSNRWKDLWTTVPCLHFEEENPEFIYGVVARWRGAKIQRFYLLFLLDDDQVPCPTSSDLESWLHFAVEKQVEELYAYTHIPYCPPQSLYSCSSITTLHLQYCSLEIEGNVQLNQLVTLSVYIPDFSWVEVINKLLSGAPRLENMTLSAIASNLNFNIISLSLKTLIIENSEINGVLAISAPNLLTLRIGACIYNGANLLFHVPSLTEACFEGWGDDVYDPPLETFYQLLRSICHAKKFTLTLLNIKLLLSLKKKKDMVVRFPNAEVLKYESWNYIDLLDLLDLLELFPKLKMLSFHRNRQYFKPIAEKTTFPSCSLLHLDRVHMTWPARDPSIIPFIQILLQNSPSLNKLVFRLKKYRNNRGVVLMVEEKVRSMPRSSPTAEVTIIDC
ncbi:F-box/FBD/LRR-repeat protein At3g26920-like [Salvia miltiorrhiza]|uniref:F-box/FBD/LRR-repeat protein At3g26920-like n=1 Tax=Salvia miltiorrhiza TaxID=226208 RepID=UPI0025ACBF32|nr:F-box/FBD/LRR-repeat protein At3g26920-like [Salvia miltiorrhiza]